MSNNNAKILHLRSLILFITSQQGYESHLGSMIALVFVVDGVVDGCEAVG